MNVEPDQSDFLAADLRTKEEGMLLPTRKDRYILDQEEPQVRVPVLRCLRLKLGLLLGFFVYAILLDSASMIVVEKVADSGLSKGLANFIPRIPELAILTLSLIAASSLNRLEFRSALLVSLGGMAVACVTLPLFFKNLSAVVTLFVVGGTTFVMTKTASYSLIGLFSSNHRRHVSFLCILEAVFMAGILFGNLLFFGLLDRPGSKPGAWIYGFYVIAALATIAFFLVKYSSIDERPAKITAKTNIRLELSQTLRLIFTPLIAAFIISNLLYVLSEQSVVNWFPAFDRSVIHRPLSLNVQQMVTLLILAAGLGRCVAAFFLRRFHWLTVLLACLFAVCSLVLFIIPLGENSSLVYSIGKFSAPLAAFILPLVIFFLAPIYPAINSAVLTATPQTQHARVAGLIMFFSAIGGITGKTVTSMVFSTYGAESALNISLISIGVLVISLFYFDRLIENKPPAKRAPLSGTSAGSIPRSGLFS